jgi:hypothetical protein
MALVGLSGRLLTPAKASVRKRSASLNKNASASQQLGFDF